MSLGFDAVKVKKIAKLAALHIEDHDIPKYCEALTNTFNLINQMTEVDTQAVAPMSHPLDAQQRLRADRVTDIDRRKQLLALAPKTEAGFILVPKVIE